MIVSIVCAFLSTVGIGVFFVVRPDPTCFDGRRNQGESSTDCGGPCRACADEYHPEAFVIRETAIVPGGNKTTYDALVRVQNPNDELGASELAYEFRLRDADGSVLDTIRGTGFILPQETKTFLAVGLHSETQPAAVEVVFVGQRWQKFSGYQEKPSMSVVDTRYGELTSGPFFSEAVGTLMNDSEFDFRSILVKVVLRDGAGKPIALNQTEMNTVLSRESREFVLRWPKSFPGAVARIEVEPDVDFFRDENFVKRYREPEMFQDAR